MPPSDPEGPILVVDDGPDVRQAIVDTLQDEGYQVVESSGGKEALPYLRSHPPPSLIFLDWNMAPMNAPQFMDEFTNDTALQGVPEVLIQAAAHGLARRVRVAAGERDQAAGVLEHRGIECHLRHGLGRLLELLERRGGLFGMPRIGAGADFFTEEEPLDPRLESGGKI